MKNYLMAMIEKQSTWNRATGKLYNLKKTEKNLRKKKGQSQGAVKSLICKKIE